MAASHPVSVIRRIKLQDKSRPTANDPCVDGPPLARDKTELRIAGWCGHVSDLFMRLYLPLAMMPFARTGSRSVARTRSAWVVLGFPGPAVFNRLFASASSRPFQPLRPV